MEDEDNVVLMGIDNDQTSLEEQQKEGQVNDSMPLNES